MNPLELALARSKAYALFEMLFLEGVTPRTKKSVSQIPELVEHLDDSYRFDELAAEHYAVFVHNVPPYASILLEENGQPGGTVTENAARAFRSCGFKPSTTSEGADHIGHILGCLSFLCGAESDAWEDGQHSIAGQMRQIQVEILDEQLLPWLFPLWWSIRSQKHKFFVELANLTVNIATDHFVNLHKLGPQRTNLLAEDEKFEIEHAKLGDIADYLLKPSTSGLWLTPTLISEIGRDFNLPRGFGDRKMTLLNLLKAAGKYSSFSALMENLTAEYTEAHINFENIKNERPVLSPYLFYWSSKICTTSSLLHDLAETWKKEQTVEV